MGLLGAGVAIGVVFLFLALKPRVAPLSRAVAALQAKDKPAPPAQAGVQVATSAALEERSRLADGLGDPKGDVHSDLRVLDGIFAAYRSALRDGNPVGENVDITAALRGRNKLQYAFVPTGCPAVNSSGELCDRWGTPYFFHQISGERMEIRSAGPDHHLWTEDDVVLTP